jgi:hypothetical protein
MSAGQTDLLACVPAFSRALEGPFDSQRFLHDFSAHAQALVPHDGMFIAWLEDEGRTFSAFARNVVGPDVVASPLRVGLATPIWLRARR